MTSTRDQTISDLTEIKNLLLAAQKKMYDIGYNNPFNEAVRANNKAIEIIMSDISLMNRGGYPFTIVKDD